jgi:integrase
MRSTTRQSRHWAGSPTDGSKARKVLVSLKSLLNVAVEREWIAASPAALVKLKRQARHDKQEKIPTKDEIRRLIEHAPTRYRALIVTGIFTGMRISELRGLTWDHVDFARRIIMIRQRANRLNEIGPPKSKAGNRDIPMNPLVIAPCSRTARAIPRATATSCAVSSIPCR